MTEEPDQSSSALRSHTYVDHACFARIEPFGMTPQLIAFVLRQLCQFVDANDDNFRRRERDCLTTTRPCDEYYEHRAERPKQHRDFQQNRHDGRHVMGYQA